MQTIVSDVSRVTLLRKRLGRAASSMKVIGLISAVSVMVYGSDHVRFWGALALGILVFWFAFRLSNRLRLGETSAARFVTLWVVVFLAWDLFDALPKALKNGIDFYTVIGSAIFSLPIYFAIRGLLHLRAYKSGLTSNPSKFEPLTLHPWEDRGKGVRKHPRFLNKSSLMAYVFVLLAPLLWLFMTAVSLNNKGPSSSDPAHLLGYNTAQIAGSLYHLKNRGLKAHALAGGHDGGSLA